MDHPQIVDVYTSLCDLAGERLPENFDPKPRSDHPLATYLAQILPGIGKVCTFRELTDPGEELKMGQVLPAERIYDDLTKDLQPYSFLLLTKLLYSGDPGKIRQRMAKKVLTKPLQEYAHYIMKDTGTLKERLGRFATRVGLLGELVHLAYGIVVSRLKEIENEVYVN